MLNHTWIKPWARIKCRSLCRELPVTSQAQHSVLCCSSIRYGLKFRVTCKTVLSNFVITYFSLCWHCTLIWALVPASHHTGGGISWLTPLWGIRQLTPLHPTNGMLYAPGLQYIVVGGKAVWNAWHGCHGRHLEGRQQTVRGIKGC